MARFARMHEKGWCSSRGEGRSDLARDVSGFTHTGHDYTALRGADQVDGGGKTGAESVAQRRSERSHTASFSFQRTQGRCDRGLCPIAGGNGWFGFRHGILIARKLLYVRLEAANLLTWRHRSHLIFSRESSFP